MLISFQTLIFMLIFHDKINADHNLYKNVNSLLNLFYKVNEAESCLEGVILMLHLILDEKLCLIKITHVVFA